MNEDRNELDKATLRVRARVARRSITPEVREDSSYAIAERVLGLPEMQDAGAVLLYGASPEEVETLPIEQALRERGVRIAYPRVGDHGHLDLYWLNDRSELERGSFGLLEPPEGTDSALPSEIDAIIVPGVAFDAEGGRLGYGGGYYDVLLAGPCAGVPAIGVAFDEQVVSRIPCEEGDQRVCVLVTPTRTIRCATSRL